MADPIIQSMLAEQAYGPVFSSQYSDAAKAARANEIARRIGMDPDLVESAMPDMMAEDRMQRVIGEARKNEAYARIMSNWRLAPAAIDDEQLPKVAQTTSDVIDASKMSFLSKAQLYGSSILKSFPQASANFYRMLQMGVDSLHSLAAKGSTADEELPVLSSWLDRAARSQEEFGRVPTTTSPTLNAVVSGGQSFGPSIMAGIAALMGQPEAGGALMGGLTAGQTYKQSKDQGATQGQAVSNALQQGAEETIFETLGGRLFKGFVDEGGNFLTHILPRQLLTEVATEIPTTWAQNLSQYANVDMPQGNEGFGDFLKHTFGEDTLSTVIATVAMAGPMIGGSYGVHTAFNRVVNGQIDKRANQQVDRMMNAAAQSSTRTANPSDFEEALNQLVGDTSAGTLYIPADKVQELFQSDDGGAHQAMADDPFWGPYEDQVNEAAAIGGDVVVPLATAATHLAGSPQWAALKEHVRTRPGGASLSELKDRPVDTEQLAADLASRLDEVIPQLHADRLTKQFATDLGYEGEQADAVSRLLAAGMIRAHAIENAKRQARGEAPVPLDEFAKDYLPQAQKMTQVEYDAGKQGPITVQSYVDAYMRGEGRDDPEMLQFAANNGSEIEAEFKRRKASEPSAKDKPAIAPGAAVAENVKRGNATRILDLARGGAYGERSAAVAADMRGILSNNAAFPKFSDWLSKKIGTRNWAVAARLTERLRAKGIEKALSQKRYRELEDEWAKLANDAFDAANVPDRFPGREGLSLPSEMTSADLEPRKGEILSAIVGVGETTIQATIVGDLAVHHPYGSKTGWTISHAPTGLSIQSALPKDRAFGTKSEAVAFAKELMASAPEAWAEVRSVSKPGMNGMPDGAEEALRAIRSAADAVIAKVYGATFNQSANETAKDEAKGERKGVPPIAPDMLRKIMRGGHVLEDTFRRGNISIARDEHGLMSGAIIRAFEAADFSTAVHELGHFFIEDLKRRALSGEATEQERADWQAFTDWAAENGHALTDNTIPTEAHELWARGFERYIYEGKAPSSKLKVMFARMRDFMMSLYRSIRAFNSPITPEIREVMDRLLASDEEIAAQREEMRLVGDQLASLMSESERQAYIDLGNESREAARDQLFERVMSTLRAERDRQFAARKRQIKDEVAAALDETPVFKALRFMRVGIPQEGGAQRVSLPRDWVVENYGEDMLEKLPKPVDLIVNNTHGVDPEYIASQAGFESADQMMSALVLSEQQRQFIKSGGDERSVRQAMIDATTQARVRDELGDPYADLEDEAKAALANEKEADRLSLELRALARKAGKRPTAWQMAKEWARGHVRSKTAKDAISGASLQMYARNAAKAAREVEEALVADKFDEAFAAKQRQLLNMALLQQAKQAKDEVDKAVRRMQKIAGRDTIRSVDQDYLDQAHQLLEAVDLKTRPSSQTDKRLAFEEWYAKQVQNGVEPVVPPQYRALLGKTNWEQLPIGDLLQLDEAVNQVIELGRLKQTLKDGKKKRDFEEGVAEMQGSGEQIPPRAKGKTTDPRRSLPGRIRSRLRSIDAAMLKVEQMATWLDNGDPNGPWSRLLFRPLADAQGHETDLLRTYTKELNALVKSLPRAQVRAWTRLVDTPELVIRNANHLNDGEAWSGTKDQVVMMAMNWGNEGNRQRLLDGFGWKEGDVLAVFDRILTKEDWDFVQGVWDTVDKLWPDIAALEREVNGVSPEKVEATAVETPHGVYRGGYFPAVYDPTQSTRAAQDEAESLAPNGAWFTVTTRASSTKARAQQVKGRPLLLSMNVITRHVGEVIHDVTHRQAVSQAKRLLTDPRIHATISNRLGPEYAKAMSAWLENVARPNSSFSKSNPTGVAIGRYLNKGVSLVGLGFRMTTSLVQLLGIPVAGKMLGSRYLGKGVAIVTAHPVQAWKEMTERSAEMRARADTLDATIEDMVHQQSTSNAIRTIGPKGMEKYAFQGIVWMDMLTTTTVWTGAFNKALDEGMTEEDAVFYADKAVRTTQGTGGMKDRSAIQNEHPLVRSLYPFFSYMNALYNMQRDVFRQAAHARSASDLAEAARQAWWVFIVPMLLQSLIFGDGPDAGDDGEVDGLDWVKYLSASIVLGNLGSLPLIGNLANAIGGGWSYRSNAYQQIGEGIKNGYEHGVKLAKGDEELKGSTVQSVLTTVGLLTAKPLGQIGATSRGLYDYATGEAEPQDAGDWYELLTKGRISDRPTAAERLTGESG